jgi:hypothetical protein
MRQPSVSISIAQPGVQVPISRYLFEGIFSLASSAQHLQTAKPQIKPDKTG